jgi:hypothetical protein
VFATLPQKLKGREMSLGMQTHPNNKIRLQFCGAADVKQFERRHYVRKMTEENRTEHSKAVGEVRGHHGQQIHYLIWYQGEKIGAISGGSAVSATKCRDEFFKITKEKKKTGRKFLTESSTTPYSV